MDLGLPNQSVERTGMSRSAQFQLQRQWRLIPVAHLDRSGNLRAYRAKPKSRRDDMRVAQGKRSAALGNETIMNIPSLHGLLCRPDRSAKQTVKRGLRLLAGQPRAAVAARLCPGLLSCCPSGATDRASYVGYDVAHSHLAEQTGCSEPRDCV